MVRCVEKVAKSVDEAVELALNELQVSKEDVDIEVLEEGTKAVLGLFGGKEAKVLVTVKFSETDIIREFIDEIVKAVGCEATVETFDTDEGIEVEINGEEVGCLIGRHGDTLNAIQYLANLIVNQNSEEYVRVTVDVENYKKARKEKLIAIANKAAERATKYKRSVSMDPMSSYDRKIVHSALQNNKYIETASQGEEPNRFVVVRYKSPYNGGSTSNRRY